jgi:hypothetical protein
MMSPGAAYLFEIVVFASSADALLGGAGAGIITLLASQKNVLKLIHSGIREKERGIIGRNQG